MEFFRGLVYEQYFLSIPPATASFASKTVIITGASNGLGKEAAKQLAQLGCQRLILAVRNVAAGETSRNEIVESTKASKSSIEVWQVDLASFSSVRSFIKRASELDRLDALICNAGINTTKFTELEGFESMLTVNVLSTYLMAKQMLPILERTARAGPLPGDKDPRAPHLTIVGSDTHLIASFPERTQPVEKMLSTMTADCANSGSRLRQQYATSKLLDLLFGRVLAKDVTASGSSVVVNVVNPGLCYSNLGHEMGGAIKVVYFLFRARSTAMGASALVNAASAGEETHGQYLSSNRVHPGGALSKDMTLAEKLRSAVELALA